MTALLDKLCPGDDATLLVFNVVLQTTAVILLTMCVVRTFLRRRPVAGHAAWLRCLAFVVACPLIAVVANQASTAVISFGMKTDASVRLFGNIRRRWTLSWSPTPNWSVALNTAFTVAFAFWPLLKTQAGKICGVPLAAQSVIARNNRTNGSRRTVGRNAEKRKRTP